MRFGEPAGLGGDGRVAQPVSPQLVFRCGCGQHAACAEPVAALVFHVKPPAGESERTHEGVEPAEESVVVGGDVECRRGDRDGTAEDA
jgi:hypothetical protein